MNAMPPDAGVPRATGGATSGGRDSRRRRRGCSSGSAQQTDGPYWRRGSLAPDYDAHRVRRSSRRRLDGLLRRRGGPHAGALHERRTADASSATGSTLPGRRLPGPEPRLAPRDGPLLRSVAQRHANGCRRGAGAHLVRARVRRAGAVPRNLAGALAGGRGVPVAGRGRGRSPAERCAVGRLVRRRRRGRRGRRRRRPSCTRRPSAPGSLSWGAGGAPNGLAGDLRPDEAAARPTPPSRSTTPSSIVGVPEVVLHLRRRCRSPPCVVRLSDVSPDGVSAQVSAGDPEPDPSPVGHRSRTAPRAARSRRSGSPAPAGYRFLPGHRIRLSVATSSWPVLWPSRAPASSGSTAVPRRRHGWCCPVVPPRGRTGRRPRAAVPDHAIGPARGRLEGRPIPRSGGSTRTCCAGPSR